MEAAIRERVKQWMEKRTAADKDDDNDNGESGKPEDLETGFEEITELILDGRQFKTVGDADAALLKKLKNLSKLACNQTGLTSVSNFPCMVTVKSLELTDNHISGGLEELVKAFPNLKRLQLGGNHLKNYADIEPLKQLEHLEQLGLDMSPLSSNGDYREKIFEMLPQLVVLDSQDKDGREVDAVGSDDDEEEEEEEDEQEAADTTLKDFYEKDLDEEDDEDEEDFQPEGDEEDDEDLEEEGDGEDESAGEEEGDGEEETANEESKGTEEEEQQQQQAGRKRKGSAAEQLENGDSETQEESTAKHARVD